ncbi:MAG: helix-turn-helix transcriptional regulator [Anaerolineales bacterium]|nr:helix-turn-helix transcriptional regulator [Anaerolineales bacterium]
MRVPLPDETILGLLAAAPQHGYQLLAHFEAKAELGRVWTLSRSQLYAVLKRLEATGAARGQDFSSGSSPTRRVYTLTGAGRRQLDAWLGQAPLSASMRQIRVQFISRLYIARLLDLPLDDLLERQRAACQAQLAHLQAALAEASSPTEALVLDFVSGQIEAALDWLDRCEALVADPTTSQEKK